MAVPFLNNITLNKNEVQNFKVYNVGTGDPTLTSGGDKGYLWTDTANLVIKWWDGSAVRTLLDSSSTTIVAADLSGGAAGSLPYQIATNDTGFLGIGTAGQVLTVSSGAPAWTSQSNLSVGSATWLNGGAQGDIPVQSAAGTTGFLNIGANGRILTSNGTTPVWSASIPASSVSGLAASATTDTTNASNISSGTLGLARLSLASGQFYVGDGSNNPAATAKSSIPLSGFGAAGADVAMGGFKITGLGAPTASTDAATMGYVDSVAQGLDVKASCKVGTIANITLSGPGASIDGISLSVDDRVLVKDQSDKKENGIYLWKGAAVAMVRSPDADTVAKLTSAFTFVEQGTNADSGWVCTVDSGTIGSVNIEWLKFSQAGSYTPGNGIVQSGTSFNFAQSSAYTAGQIPFAGGTLGTSSTSIGFDSNFVWDDQANRLGIGTATPRSTGDCYGTLTVGSNTAPQLDFKRDVVIGGVDSGIGSLNYGGRYDGSSYGVGALITGQSAGAWTASSTAGYLSLRTTAASATTPTERLRIASDGVCTWSNVGGVAGTAMTLNGSGLGIGATPATGNSAGLTVGAIGTARNISLSMYQSNARIREWDSNNTVALVTNINVDNVIDNNALSSWKVQLGSGLECFRVARAAAGSTTFAEFFRVDNAGNVGIGTATPNYKLHILNDGGSAHAVRIYGTGANASYLALNASNTDTGIIAGGSSAVPINFYTGGTLRATIDSSGNLGLGVTPYVHASTYKTLQLGNGGNYATLAGSSNSDGGADAYGQLVLGNNSYDFPNNKAVGTGASTIYLQSGGRHRWYTAPSANAGTLQSFTNTMTLDASGNLRVGAAAAAGVLTVTNSTTNTSIGLINLSGFANTNTNSIDFYLDNSNSGVVTHGVIGCINTAATANRYGELFFKTANAAAPVTRIRIKAQGQLNLVPISADPAGPEAGDVYYNSTSNTLKWYGTAWNTLPRKYVVQLSDGSVTVLGNAYTITHNLGSQDVTVSIRRTTDNAVVQADVVMPAGGNTVTVTFAAAITAAQFYVTVIG